MAFARTLPDAEPRPCQGCGGIFTPPRKFAKQRFCGHKCAYLSYGAKLLAASRAPAAIAKRGDAQRGSGAGNGYVKRNGRHEHRIVAEEKIGRPLLRSEVAHHDDEVKSNNAPGNILVMPRADHSRLHQLGKKRAPRTVCKNGHRLEGGNVHITSVGRRRCLICQRAYDRDWHMAKRRALKEIQT